MTKTSHVKYLFGSLVSPFCSMYFFQQLGTQNFTKKKDSIGLQFKAWKNCALDADLTRLGRKNLCDAPDLACGHIFPCKEGEIRSKHFQMNK